MTCFQKIYRVLGLAYIAIHSSTPLFAAQVIVGNYSNVIPNLAGNSQFTVSGGAGTGLTIGGLSTELLVVVFAEVFRDGEYRIIGALDNYSIRTKYPNGYGTIRPETSMQWGVIANGQPDRYIAGVDYNGDGRIGLWDNVAESLMFDPGEYVSPENISIGSQPAFVVGNGYQIRSVAIIPEPSAFSLTLLGSVALIWRRQRQNINK